MKLVASGDVFPAVGRHQWRLVCRLFLVGTSAERLDQVPEVLRGQVHLAQDEHPEDEEADVVDDDGAPSARSREQDAARRRTQRSRHAQRRPPREPAVVDDGALPAATDTGSTAAAGASGSIAGTDNLMGSDVGCGVGTA